jgi:glycosyltransferase involved in cell wall biosynthesis
MTFANHRPGETSPGVRPRAVAALRGEAVATAPIGYLTSRYPAISHTFILHEVRALRRLGLDVRTYSARRVTEADVITPLERDELARTSAILPCSPARVAAAHLRAFVRRPHRYLATLAAALRMSPGGARGALWQLFYFAEAVLFLELCQRDGVRHVHVHHANVAADVALLAAELDRPPGGGCGLKWSLTMHGPTEFYEVRRFNLAVKVTRAGYVICISPFARSQLMMLVDEKHWAKLEVVPCGVDTELFTPPASRARDDAVEILTVARLVRGKGLSVMIGALGRLRERGVPARLTIVGDGPYLRPLQALVDALDLSQRVTFMGAMGQEQLRERYAEADVFCMSSFAEGVPIVLMEAMAMELPVVTTSVMGIPELVHDGVSGILIRPGAEVELADALERLARDPELRRRMGRAGRLAVLAERDLDGCADRLQAVMHRRLAASMTGRE